MEIKNYITPKGLNKLKKEYQELCHQERPKLLEVIAWAASNGDRSENADYIYGKRRLREIDKRLRFLAQRIEVAEVVDPKEMRSNKILFGATVTILDENEVQKTYTIVGEDEAQAEEGCISWKSPVAKALMGKSVGDEAVLMKPSGEETVEILELVYK
ncbi:MAG: transcription elongation factor GreB [Pseudobdellovibrionaceae bacterium]